MQYLNEVNEKVEAAVEELEKFKKVLREAKSKFDPKGVSLECVGFEEEPGISGGEE